MTEEELIERAQGGDDAAFDELVRLTLPGTYRFLRGMGASVEDAEDAAQEAYVRAWRAFGRFDPRKPFHPWLYQIAKRAFIDRTRSRRAILFSDIGDEGDALDVPDAEPLPDEVFAREESREEVQRALAELPPRDQTVLSLRYGEEFSFEEIAQTLEIPSATVRSIHRRALVKMRDILEY